MKQIKYYFIVIAVIISGAFVSSAFDSYLRSQERQKELEIKKLELQLKLKGE